MRSFVQSVSDKLSAVRVEPAAEHPAPTEENPATEQVAPTKKDMQTPSGSPCATPTARATSILHVGSDGSARCGEMARGPKAKVLQQQSRRPHGEVCTDTQGGTQASHRPQPGKDSVQTCRQFQFGEAHATPNDELQRSRPHVSPKDEDKAQDKNKEDDEGQRHQPKDGGVMPAVISKDDAKKESEERGQQHQPECGGEVQPARQTNCPCRQPHKEARQPSQWPCSEAQQGSLQLQRSELRVGKSGEAWQSYQPQCSAMAAKKQWYISVEGRWDDHTLRSDQVTYATGGALFLCATVGMLASAALMSPSLCPLIL